MANELFRGKKKYGTFGHTKAENYDPAHDIAKKKKLGYHFFLAIYGLILALNVASPYSFKLSIFHFDFIARFWHKTWLSLKSIYLNDSLIATK